MKLRDLIQELKRFNFETETNVVGLKKNKDGLELKIKDVKVKSKSDKSV